MSDLPERFWRKVEKTDACWNWTGSKDMAGYGKYEDHGKRYLAHRVAYEDAKGPIPEGLVIDHLCRVKGCVNPDHMEPVTIGENVARGVAYERRTCRRGHPMTEVNTYTDTRGKRRCRRCNVLLVLRHRGKWGGGTSEQAENERVPCLFCGDGEFTRAELKQHFTTCVVFRQTAAHPAKEQSAT